MKKQHTVIFQPSGRRGLVDEGLTLIEASRRLGVDIEALCGEQKVCGKCQVRIEEGYFPKFGLESGQKHTTPWQEEESRFIDPDRKATGIRLACAARVMGDLLIYVPEEFRAGKQVVSKAARNIPIDWDPAIKLYAVEVTPPSFREPTGDFERILNALREQHGLNVSRMNVDIYALRTLPRVLRHEDFRWTVTVAIWMDREIVRFRPGKVEDAYGVAVDLGTTTCCAYLCNLRTMEVVETASMMNPQCKYGEDVMARITYHMTHEDGLSRMSSDIIDGLNALLQRCCDSADPHVDPEDVVDMTLVGNTAMHHICLSLDPEFMGLAPFPPVIHRSLDIKARDLGLHINRSCYLHVLPIEAGFVGADNVGVLVAEEPYKSDQIQLIIDIGTNGELVLGNKNKLISSSCATGPALEGAQITWGMRAAPGAIERIKIDPATHEVDYKVIGRDAWRSYSDPEDMRCKGICGSGILDVLAELYQSGVILKSGRFNPQQKSERFRRNPHDTQQTEFVIAWANETPPEINRDIVITQKDIRQIQLAKGALYTGCKLMMRRMGVSSVDVVKIAGAFGIHVDREKALVMGLFPDCDIDKIHPVGNAAGDGARAALLNRKKRDEADWCSRNVEYIELTIEPNFQEEFARSMQIPHMRDTFPHLEDLVLPEILKQK